MAANSEIFDEDYQTFLRLRKQGEFEKYDPTWLAVIQCGQLISVIATYEEVFGIPSFEDADRLVQPITDDLRSMFHLSSSDRK